MIGIANANTELFKKTIRKLWDSTDTKPYIEYPKIYKVETSDEEWVRDMQMAGLPYGGPTEDGAPITLTDPIYGDTKDRHQRRFTNGFAVTDGMRRFNKWDQVATLTRNLKKTMAEMRDIELALIPNNPTSTAYGIGFDGKALLSSSHDLLNGGTYSNYVQADLSITALNDMRIYFFTNVNDRGHLSPLTPDTLVYPPQLDMLVGQLFQSNLVPFEQSNTDNPIKRWGITPVMYGRMTDADAWFGLNKNHPHYNLKVTVAQEPDLIVEDSADTARNIWITSQQWFTYGFYDPRYIYGGVPA